MLVYRAGRHHNGVMFNGVGKQAFRVAVAVLLGARQIVSDGIDDFGMD